MDFADYDYSEKLNHENRITAVVWDYASMRNKALIACKDRGLTPKEALTVAVKLSVDSTNLDRFTPISLTNGTKFTNIEAKQMLGGRADNATDLTVNRFCAVLSPEISKYLERHPTEIWGQNEVLGASPKYCFPHSYYIPDLRANDRREIHIFLLYMDEVMSSQLANWRSIALKAAFYWKRKFGDVVRVTGDSFSIDFQEE